MNNSFIQKSMQGNWYPAYVHFMAHFSFCRTIKGSEWSVYKAEKEHLLWGTKPWEPNCMKAWKHLAFFFSLTPSKTTGNENSYLTASAKQNPDIPQISSLQGGLVIVQRYWGLYLNFKGIKSCLGLRDISGPTSNTWMDFYLMSCSSNSFIISLILTYRR